MLNQLLAHQLAHPKGLFGRFVGRMMDRGNAPMNEFVVRCMDAAPYHHTLEVGFGSGWVLRHLLQTVNCEYVAGVEISQTMLARAKQRLECELTRGRLDLHNAGVHGLPFADERFDRVCSVNTIYFWDDPVAGLIEINRVLNPSGRFVLGFRPAHSLRGLPFTKHGFRIYEKQRVIEMMNAAGYGEVELRENLDGHLGCICAIARKA